MINLTDQMIFRLGNLNKESARISYQMSSGKQLDRGSDDSSVFARELYVQDKIRVYEGLQVQVDKTTAQNNVADSSMSEMKNLLDSIKTEMLKALNSGMDASDKKAVAVSIGGMKDNLLTLSNETVNGEYIFAGSNTTIKPFSKDNSGKVTYNGDAILRQIAVEPNTYRDRGVTGFDILMYSSDEATATDTLDFYESERVIDQSGLEWKLNAGKTALEQYDINGNLSGNTLAITGNDGGVPPKYTTDTIDQAGGYATGMILSAKHNVFDDIDEIVNSLNTNDTDSVRASLDKIDSAYDASNIAHSKLGARNKIFEIAGESIASRLTHYNILYQEVAGADLSKVAMESKSLEMTYTALYSTISKMNELSLINFVR